MHERRNVQRIMSAGELTGLRDGSTANLIMMQQ